MRSEPDELLREMFDAAVAAALPRHCLPALLPEPPRGRTVVVGCGKASAAMARVVEEHWNGPLSGMVVTRDGHAVACERIEILEASHPVPDGRSEAAGRRLLQEVRGLTADDLVIALVSGGASSLASVPAGSLSLLDKQQVNAELLRCGAPIGAMNIVRKHLSAIKGGQLAAAAWPARLVTLVISDVPGDDPSVIGSGPTVADPHSFAEAREVLRRYGVAVPEAVRAHLEAAAVETPKPGDPRLARTSVVMAATPQMSLEAAARVARNAGVTPVILGDSLEGEAREMAIVLAGIARQAAVHGQPGPPPVVLLSGGEATVTIRGKGRGGRNVEFLLALALALGGRKGVFAIAGDTDGIDGAENAAGATISPDTLEHAARLGLSPRSLLENNDAHSFFERLGTRIVTGPTLTNVNDFRAILVLPEAAD